MSAKASSWFKVFWLEKILGLPPFPSLPLIFFLASTKCRSEHDSWLLSVLLYFLGAFRAKIVVLAAVWSNLNGLLTLSLLLLHFLTVFRCTHTKRKRTRRHTHTDTHRSRQLPLRVCVRTNTKYSMCAFFYLDWRWWRYKARQTFSSAHNDPPQLNPSIYFLYYTTHTQHTTGLWPAFLCTCVSVCVCCRNE